MKWNLKFLSALATAVIALATSAIAQSQPPTVADIARANRKAKAGSSHVLTNESLSLRAASPDTTNYSSPSATDAAKADATKAAADKAAAGDTPEDRQKLIDEWKSKIEGQKNSIAQLQRELDLATRENKLRAAAYYGDAGTRLRDSQKAADDDRKFQAESAEKQKAIASAQQALDKMRDEARRAGVPAGQIP
jgi:hypothetical protein